VSEHSKETELLEGPLFFSSSFSPSSSFPPVSPFAISSSVIELSVPGPVGL